MDFRHFFAMSVRGFEPRTTWLKVKCSTTWATRPHFCIKTYLNHKECPEPESNQRHEDFQSSALPTELSGHKTLKVLSCGGRIWTYDLRVMSPTSFQTAPPRDIKFSYLLWDKADDRTRTDNLLITNQLLCQLSHIGTEPLSQSIWFVISTLHAIDIRQF